MTDKWSRPSGMRDAAGNQLTNAQVLAAVTRFLHSCRMPGGRLPWPGELTPGNRGLLPVELQPEAEGILAWAVRRTRRAAA